MKENNKYDIIGDIHGYADVLRDLLAKLGYVEENGVYRHDERRVIFVGDFIDRGPKIRETLRMVKAMVDAGSAHAVMGNHEFNAICYHTEVESDGHLRSHTLKDGKNKKQHRATLEQLADPFPEEWVKYLNWFKSLPMFLELDGIRVVHAAWDHAGIEAVRGRSLHDRDFLFAAATEGTPEYLAVERVLKGPEIELPKGITYHDKEGTERTEIRLNWCQPFDGEVISFRDAALPRLETLPDTPIPTALLDGFKGYEASEPPVFFGHYWLPPQKPEPMAGNAVCLDYSVAKNGFLTAYRWEGERKVDPGKYVTAPAR